MASDSSKKPQTPRIALHDFKSNLKDVARPNRFTVRFVNVPGPSAAFLSSLESTFMVKGSSIPKLGYGELEVKHLGMTQKLGGDIGWPNPEVTFLADAAWRIREAMEDWADQVHVVDDDGGYIMGDFANTYGNSYMYVDQLDHKGHIIATYEFHEVYPLSIGEIALSHDANDQAEEFTVEFSCAWIQRKHPAPSTITV